MKLPQMQYAGDRRTQQTIQFGALQYGRGGGEGDFAQTLNLSSRLFPALSQRPGRALVQEYQNATALFAKNKLLVVSGTSLYYDGEVVGTVTPGEKMIAAVNTKIIIFPDKVYYDTASHQFGSMEASTSASAAAVTWTTGALKLTVDDLDLTDLFSVGQGLRISGSSIGENNKTLTVRAVSTDTLTFAYNSFTEGTESGTVTVAREVPDLVCICESGNRLWGADGDTIYASALGDPLTFFSYEGVATDSYAVAVGTDGVFTACGAYSSNVLFFKETMLHKVLGAMPSEYRIYDYTIPGVQAGSQKSLVIINEVLYYKGPDGVYAYSGATPALISENFGVRTYRNAAAGTDGSRYYISMQDMATDDWNLYVYDPMCGVWLREDDTHVIDFARLDTRLHFLSGADGGVWAVGQGEEEPFPWEAEFYPLDDTIYGKRGYSKLWLKVDMEKGAHLKAEISEDGAPWRQAGIWHCSRAETVTAPVYPVRCDTFRLKLSGLGRCTIKNMVREFDIGSER